MKGQFFCSGTNPSEASGEQLVCKIKNQLLAKNRERLDRFRKYWFLNNRASLEKI